MMKQPRFSGQRTPQGRQMVTLYIFRSDKNSDMCAFAFDALGSALPDKLAPWTSIGTVLPGRSPPHGLSRSGAEERIRSEGYVLWRLKAATS
jgi:hypothetical protein